MNFRETFIIGLIIFPISSFFQYDFRTCLKLSPRKGKYFRETSLPRKINTVRTYIWFVIELFSVLLDSLGFMSLSNHWSKERVIVPIKRSKYTWWLFLSVYTILHYSFTPNDQRVVGSKQNPNPKCLHKIYHLLHL